MKPVTTTSIFKIRMDRVKNNHNNWAEKLILTFQKLNVQLATMPKFNVYDCTNLQIYLQTLLSIF